MLLASCIEGGIVVSLRVENGGRSAFFNIGQAELLDWLSSPYYSEKGFGEIVLILFVDLWDGRLIWGAVLLKSRPLLVVKLFLILFLQRYGVLSPGNSDGGKSR